MPYFTTDELRALPDLPVSRFTDERLVAAHDWIVAIIERECDTSFIHRTMTERLTGSGTTSLVLTNPYVVDIAAVSVDGVDLTTGELDALFVEHGILYSPFGAYWSAATRGNVTITYTAGYSAAPPADLKEAAMRGARNWLLTSDAWSGADARATAITNDYGNITIAVAGPERPTGLPDVDTTIMAWARRVRVPKVS